MTSTTRPSMKPSPFLLLLLLPLLWLLLAPAAAQEEHGRGEEQDVQHQKKQGGQENTRDWILRRHSRIKDTADLEAASAGEQDFLAFISHDFDDDNCLDGTELFQAFTEGSGVERRPLVEVENKVDFILHHHDEDQDGKLSFFEFTKSFLPPSRALTPP